MSKPAAENNVTVTPNPLNQEERKESQLDNLQKICAKINQEDPGSKEAKEAQENLRNYFQSGVNDAVTKLNEQFKNREKLSYKNDDYALEELAEKFISQIQKENKPLLERKVEVKPDGQIGAFQLKNEKQENLNKQNTVNNPQQEEKKKTKKKVQRAGLIGFLMDMLFGEKEEDEQEEEKENPLIKKILDALSSLKDQLESQNGETKEYKNPDPQVQSIVTHVAEQMKAAQEKGGSANISDIKMSKDGRAVSISITEYPGSDGKHPMAEAFGKFFTDFKKDPLQAMKDHIEGGKLREGIEKSFENSKNNFKNMISGKTANTSDQELDPKDINLTLDNTEENLPSGIKNILNKGPQSTDKENSSWQNAMQARASTPTQEKGTTPQR